MSDVPRHLEELIHGEETPYDRDQQDAEDEHQALLILTGFTKQQEYNEDDVPGHLEDLARSEQTPDDGDQEDAEYEHWIEHQALPIITCFTKKKKEDDVVFFLIDEGDVPLVYLEELVYDEETPYDGDQEDD